MGTLGFWVDALLWGPCGVFWTPNLNSRFWHLWLPPVCVCVCVCGCVCVCVCVCSSSQLCCSSSAYPQHVRLPTHPGHRQVPRWRTSTVWVIHFQKCHKGGSCFFMSVFISSEKCWHRVTQKVAHHHKQNTWVAHHHKENTWVAHHHKENT